MKLIGIITFTCICTQISGQVTIGSDTPPVQGALLELSEGSVTTKGLGMPRVILTDLTNIGTDIPAAAGQATLHMGMTVYNINEDLCAFNPIYKGLYVWDGNKWQKLGSEGGNYLKYTDQDGNAFRARSFGNAGIWMTENLKVTTFAATANGAQPVLNGASSTSMAYYSYPNTVITEPTSPNHEGLLYNWMAATNYYVPTQGSINQGQVSSTIPGNLEVETIGPNGPGSDGYFYVQGICPTGWHIPSDREWNELEAEIYTYATKYSTYTVAAGNFPFTPASWQSSWESVTPTASGAIRGATGSSGHGLAMMSQCPPSGANGGMSLPSAQGGFDVLPVGYVLASVADSYGYISYLWSSSYYDNGSGNTYNGIARALYTSTPTVRKIAMGRNTMNSVRCKKND